MQLYKATNCVTEGYQRKEHAAGRRGGRLSQFSKVNPQFASLLLVLSNFLYYYTQILHHAAEWVPVFI